MKIRFRVWDGEKMWYPDDDEGWLVGPDGDLHKEYEAEDADGYLYDTVGEFPGELMLSTGLVDKNGKEIWDGDIVSVMSHDTSSFPSEHDRKLFKGIVKLDLTDCYVKSLNYENTNPLNCFSERATQCEVIGSVHENPGLLT